MAKKTERLNSENRIFFLDNLRTFMIFLVVLLHAGLVYEKSGFPASWWIVFDQSKSDIPGLLFFILDIFIMATIFFVSGYFAPLSLKKKSVREFLWSKIKRLIFPWIIAVLTLIPLYKFIFLYARNLPQENWTTYFHWGNGFISQSWLWFLPVLFLFEIFYLLLSRVKTKQFKISLKKAVFLVFAAGVLYSFLMDILNWQGWTKTVFVDFQNERIFIYFMIFLLGAICSNLRIFDSTPVSKKLYIVLNSIVWIPIMIYLAFFFYPYIKPGAYIFSQNWDTLIKWTNFHLSLLSMLYILINTFRFYFNRNGKIGAELNANSYGVYVIHLILLGGIALTMLNTTIPSLLKYLILTVTTYAGSNLIMSFYKRSFKPKPVNVFAP